MPKKRLSELSLRGRRVLFLSKLELSPPQRGKYLHISRDQWPRPRRAPPLSPLAPNVFGKFGGRHAGRQPSPLALAKSLRYASCRFRRIVDDHWQQERLVLRHIQHAVHCKIPFARKIAFAPRLGIGGDQRYKQRSSLDLLADRRFPRISAAQIALIEPYLMSSGTQ